MEDGAVEANPIFDLVAEMNSIGEIPVEEDDEDVEEDEEFELETPMIIYIPDVAEFLGAIYLSDSDAKYLLRMRKMLEFICYSIHL